MRRAHAPKLALALGCLLLALLSAACGAELGTPTASQTPAEAVTGSAITPAAETVTPTATATLPATPTETQTAEGTSPPETPAATPGAEATAPLAQSDEVEKAEEVVAAVSSRTPVPTPTPDIVTDKVEQIVAATGLSGKTFLGLSVEDWIDLLISLVVVCLGYLLARWGLRLLFALFKRVIRRTSIGLDHAFLGAVEQELKWLATVLVFRYALLRLDFWSEGMRSFIVDACFVVTLVLLLLMATKLIRAVAVWYRGTLESDEDRVRLEPVILIVQRTGYSVVLIVGLSVGLSHFGISVTVLSVVLVVVAVVIALGTRDIIGDFVSGAIILLDQPFRVGDVIAIDELDRWGDVVEIGTRTTRILAPDDRTVIVPNSKIGASQIVNYTYPDLEYRVYSDIAVAYGSDFGQVRRVALAAVRGVEGVLLDQPIDVLFKEYGVSARIVRVRWWIDDVHHQMRNISEVNEALEIAFEEAGIEMPVTTRSLIIQVDPGAGEQLCQPQGSPLPGKGSVTGGNPRDGEGE
jgi:small-conductance mechanosensitive channel